MRYIITFEKSYIKSLPFAIKSGKVESVRKAIKSGADVNGKFPNGHSVLVAATSLYDLDIIKLLVESGADVNAIDSLGFVALHISSSIHLEITKYLIGAGADVNIQNNNGSGWTPLHYAAYWNEIRMMRLLIEAGADWNIKNENGKYFLDMLHNSNTKKNIIELYPEKYKEYLIKKDIIDNVKKYNL